MDRQCTAQHLTATHATVTELTRNIRTWPQIVHGQFHFSPELFDDLTKKKINHCGTVRLNRKGMPEDLRYKMVKLRWEGSI